MTKIYLYLKKIAGTKCLNVKIFHWIKQQTLTRFLFFFFFQMYLVHYFIFLVNCNGRLCLSINEQWLQMKFWFLMQNSCCNAQGSFYNIKLLTNKLSECFGVIIWKQVKYQTKTNCLPNAHTHTELKHMLEKFARLPLKIFIEWLNFLRSHNCSLRSCSKNFHKSEKAEIFSCTKTMPLHI